MYIDIYMYTDIWRDAYCTPGLARVHKLEAKNVGNMFIIIGKMFTIIGKKYLQLLGKMFIIIGKNVYNYWDFQ